MFGAQLFARITNDPWPYISQVRTGGGTEVELKYLGADLDDVRRRLREAGARLAQPRALETNLVFDDAEHSLRQSDRLLRLRNGRELTVKLPLADTAYKARQEINLDVAEGDIEPFLAGLGYAVDWRYEKWREGWEVGGMWVTLDELPFIGNVVEIEGDRQKIDEVAGGLGLSGHATSTATYLELFQDHPASRGVEPRDMTFAAEAAGG
jgi:adenylate cyclase, class 2